MVNVWEQEKLEARNMLENGDESHLSSARYVGPLFQVHIFIYSHFRLCQYHMIIPIGTTVTTITEAANGSVRRSGCCFK